MRRYKEIWLEAFFKNYIPCKTDNLKQICLKVVFLLSVVGILISGIYFGNYYYGNFREEKLLSTNREIFENNDFSVSFDTLKQKNSDYCAWLKLGSTKLNCPVYKTDDNSFYINHNSLKERSSFGSLFFDYRCKMGDKNSVIYGNSLENGNLFSILEKLRTLSFYKQNSVFSLADKDGETDYIIYAVFVLNAKIKDDGDYIYNIYRNNFTSKNAFNNWCAEAKERSVIATNVDVAESDSIVTLVTGCDDFENARLVVMARSVREGEKSSYLSKKAEANKNPRYPKRWYRERNIKYPF